MIRPSPVPGSRSRWSTLTLVTTLVLTLLAPARSAAVPPVAAPFPLAAVRLLDGPFLEARQRNERYLLGLEADRLLHTFRLNVGLPSSATPYGGWEAPNVELRGHTLGHYLTALALAYASSGNEAFRTRAEGIVIELARCQAASPQAGFNPGYLSAFPESFIERVENRRPVWAPWYTLHKLMAGLLDVHQLCGNAAALDVLVQQAAWVRLRVDRLPPERMQASLDAEFGGMNEVLANLYAVTGDPGHLRLAQAFDHARVFGPLARGEDALDGLHANTQIPKAVGAAREYEVTGDPRYRTIARTFWERVAEHRSYVIGGHSDHEHFFPVDQFARHLGTDTTETCNTYNMLKLTQLVWGWEPSVRAMDFYERALFNHILAAQDPDSGMFVYLMPLKPGHFKTYSLPHNSFWCCVGTGIENPGRYASAIYAHTGSDTLYVNQFIASELKSADTGFAVRQETRFPEEDTVRLSFQAGTRLPATLKIRYPGWAGAGARVKVNGVSHRITEAPGSYLSLRREWREGDRVEVRFPMSLRTEPLPGTTNLVAFCYGPVVLAGELGTAGMPNPYAVVQTDQNGVPSPEVPVLVTDAPDWGKLVRPVTARGSRADRELARQILADPDFDFAVDRARTLLGSGLTAGSGYGEVWIRDLNTFLEASLRFVPAPQIRSNLLTFFKFQGADGNIPDGFIPEAKAGVGYAYRRSALAPGLAAHKNTVETDQETSLVQAVARYVRATGDRTLLAEVVAGRSVADRLGLALEYLRQHRFDPAHGLIWGATTVDWGDVQPEHPWGVEFDASSHRALDIYDNAMLLVALEDYLGLIGAADASAASWRAFHAEIRQNARRHLWDARREQFIPHVYLAGSPFPADFDERAIYYHGGTATAAEAGLLSLGELKAALDRMRANVRQAGAGSIGLTVYPPYPDGLFKNPGMKAWSYQNGGDWCWFGGRMVQQLIRHGRMADAYRELKPMVARVAKHGDFHEWWSRDNQPRGSAQFRGSAGVLCQAIFGLRDWARQQDPALVFRTRGLGQPGDVTLVPFHRLHHQRYSVYWRVLSREEFQREAAARAEAEARRLQLERLSVDVVGIGEQQSETDHALAGEDTRSGMHQGRRWRDASGWFSYQVKVVPDAPVALLCTWWGSDAGNRTFDLLVDGQKLTTVTLNQNRPGELYDERYVVPPELTRGRSRVEVRFQPRPGHLAGGLFGLRILRSE